MSLFIVMMASAALFFASWKFCFSIARTQVEKIAQNLEEHAEQDKAHVKQDAEKSQICEIISYDERCSLPNDYPSINYSAYADETVSISELFQLADRRLGNTNFQTLIDLNAYAKEALSSIKIYLPALKLDNPNYIIDQLNSFVAVYNKNTQDAIDELRHSKVRKKFVRAIIEDNRRLVKALEELEQSMNKMLARLYDDDNPAHLTDFTAANNLKKISAVFEKVVSEPASVPTEVAVEEKLTPKLTLEPFTPPAPKKPEEKLESELKTLAFPG
ncbi:hypothetical protein IJG21_02075 [Candidatus Saccharibacteria bacterium]|nr:hypothetical protein [Candidatus Saccharibacteria bacterium]